MIVARLKGGLGNQLFIYATARTLADELGRDLGLDLNDFWKEKIKRNFLIRLSSEKILGRETFLRPYFLDRYNIRARPEGPLGLFLRGIRRQGPPRNSIFGQAGFYFLKENGKALPKKVLKGLSADLDCYLDGYWQSRKNFEHNRTRLLKDLELKSPPYGQNAVLLQKIKGQKSVAIHIRRGDYLTPAAAAFHGILDAGYYPKAVKGLGAVGRGATYYIFSDAPAWCEKNIRVPGPRVIVQHNRDEAPEEDLRLMSACRHFIVANSTFSWWGAWLGTDKNKVVVAPKAWLKSGDVPGFCPPAWKRI